MKVLVSGFREGLSFAVNQSESLNFSLVFMCTTGKVSVFPQALTTGKQIECFGFLVWHSWSNVTVIAGFSSLIGLCFIPVSHAITPGMLTQGVL